MKKIVLLLIFPLFSLAQEPSFVYELEPIDTNKLINDFSVTIAQGNDDVLSLLSLYQKVNLPKDTLDYFMVLLDSNYLVNNPEEPLVILKFRQIFFKDQYSRYKYEYGEFESFKEVKETDETLQKEFVVLCKSNDMDTLFWNGWVNSTFSLLLTHSRYLTNSFFKDNFYLYMSF